MSGLHDYEAEARARKVARLVQAIESYAAIFEVKLVPAVMAEWSDIDWRTWAEAAGVNVPSSTTRAAVIATLTERLRRAS